VGILTKLKEILEKANKKYMEVSEKLAKVNVGRQLTKEEVEEIINPSKNKKFKELLEV